MDESPPDRQFTLAGLFLAVFVIAAGMALARAVPYPYNALATLAVVFGAPTCGGLLGRRWGGQGAAEWGVLLGLLAVLSYVGLEAFGD